MTSWALEMSAASAGLASYSCGSVFGSETMLVTLAWVPPSCDARLPQKFSAASTWMTPLEVELEVLVVLDDEPEGDLVTRYSPPTTRTTIRTPARRNLFL